MSSRVISAGRRNYVVNVRRNGKAGRTEKDRLTCAGGLADDCSDSPGSRQLRSNESNVEGVPALRY